MRCRFGGVELSSLPGMEHVVGTACVEMFGTKVVDPNYVVIKGSYITHK